jgi:hypothetical protein
MPRLNVIFEIMNTTKSSSVIGTKQSMFMMSLVFAMCHT